MKNLFMIKRRKQEIMDCDFASFMNIAGGCDVQNLEEIFKDDCVIYNDTCCKYDGYVKYRHIIVNFTIDYTHDKQFGGSPCFVNYEENF